MMRRFGQALIIFPPNSCRIKTSLYEKKMLCEKGFIACRYCGQPILSSEVVVSKATKWRGKVHYHYRCAVQLNIVPDVLGYYYREGENVD